MSETKKRTSKACDHCRVAKSKCVPLTGQLEGCVRCDDLDISCTSKVSARKRGPAKGYLSLVETRMHELEAFLGLMLTIPDPHLQEVFKTLNQETLGNSVLSKVSQSAFGPAALTKYLKSINNNGIVTNGIDPNDTSSNTPSNAWQAYALREYLLSKAKAGSRVQSRPASSTRTSIPEGTVSSILPTRNNYTGFVNSPQSSSTSNDPLFDLWTTTDPTAADKPTIDNIFSSF